MPHISVKLWPGQSEDKKRMLAEEIAKTVMATLGSSERSMSVSIEEVASTDWRQKVYKPDIEAKPDVLYKKPGYDPASL